MGFPLWTLWGMVATAVATLILLLLAYIGQSPRLLKRLGLGGTRLDLRSRTLTGFALATFLLMFGFFLAGVPLGPRPETAVSALNTPKATSETGPVGEINPVTPTSEIEGSSLATVAIDEPTQPQSSSGAMAGLPTQTSVDESDLQATAVTDLDSAIEIEETSTALATSTNTATPTLTPTPSVTPTITPTPSPTSTPTPTLTPTRVAEATAVVNTGSSTVWLQRTPGGQNLAVLKGNDIVLILTGQANMGGFLWQEISTIDNKTGWVEKIYLDYTETTP